MYVVGGGVAILVLMDYGFLSESGYRKWHLHFIVAILVLMDYGFLCSTKIRVISTCVYVAILVLMDYGFLLEDQQISKTQISQSRNPCFNGLWFFMRELADSPNNQLQSQSLF